MNEVYMDTDRVLEMASGFRAMANTLETVDKALEVAMQVLETTAFIGLVGGAVWARFIGLIRPQVKSLAEFCSEIDRDLKFAVEAFIRGDEQGASRFY
jgi:hypothetical protein